MAEILKTCLVLTLTSILCCTRVYGALHRDSLGEIVNILHTPQSPKEALNLFYLKEYKDALCLDGSPGAYYFREGQEGTTDKWIVHLMGGGWCYDEAECVYRSGTLLGSSKGWPPVLNFAGGIVSTNMTVNPKFYNWNFVYLIYCDGASFAGDVLKPVTYQGNTLYFRGKRILKAALDDLWNSKGMKNAKEVILTGCSAGGLATYLHADYVRSYLPSAVSLKALADAGYFLDLKNWDGHPHIRPQYQYIFKMQNCTGGVNQDCIAANKGEEWKCFFAQYTFPHIKTAMFQLNSAYDTWQLHNILQLECYGPNCTFLEKAAFLAYRNNFLNASKPVIESFTSGMLITSCLEHCLSMSDELWNGMKVNNMTVTETFSQWYNQEGALHEVDCPWPCNKFCPKT